MVHLHSTTTDRVRKAEKSTAAPDVCGLDEIVCGLQHTLVVLMSYKNAAYLFMKMYFGKKTDEIKADFSKNHTEYDLYGKRIAV